MTIKNTSIYGVHCDTTGRVLLVKDSNSLLWGFPGGKVEKGETHSDTLGREFLEETGMHVKGNLTYLTRQVDEVKQRYFYKIEQADGHLGKNGNGTDVEGAAYFDRLNLPLRAAPGIQDVIKHFLSIGNTSTL